MSNEEKLDVNELLTQHKNHYKGSAKSWKLGYRVFLMLSAFLSAGAAVIGKLYFIGDEKLASDISAILAGLATVSTAIVASLNFENFWRSNQKAREKVRILELEVLKAKTNDEENIKIIEELQKIIEERSGSLLRDD